MATQGQDLRACEQCGAPLAADLRYCLQCYAPVAGARTVRPHFELASQITTTHRLDPTVVFSPEKHKELVRQKRVRKRLLITSAAALTIVVVLSVGLTLLGEHRQRIAKAIARDEAAWRDLNTLAEALERFKGDVNRYPTNQEGLLSLARRPAAFPADNIEHSNYWFGPYIDHVPEVDPWGNDYVYNTPDGGRTFELFSPGPAAETASESQFRVFSQASAMTESSR